MNDYLRILIDLREQVIQKNRIAFSNRLNAIAQGKDNADIAVVKKIKNWFEWFEDAEKRIDEDVQEEAALEPIVQKLCNLKGIKQILAARIISMIDIEKAQTVSALWRYAGYGVVNGQAEKPKKGEKLHYNKRLKKACYVIGTSFLKCKSPYSDIYYKAKEYYKTHRPDWTKAHVHYAAMRKMIKLFLSHLWVVWRTLEGLPTRSPYVHEYLKHTDIKKPAEFGWKFETEKEEQDV